MTFDPILMGKAWATAVVTTKVTLGSTSYLDPLSRAYGTGESLQVKVAALSPDIRTRVYVPSHCMKLNEHLSPPNAMIKAKYRNDNPLNFILTSKRFIGIANRYDIHLKDMRDHTRPIMLP